MRSTNEYIRVFGLGLIGLSLNAWAQTMTVDDAIESAKKKKSQPAVAKAEALPTALLPTWVNPITPPLQSQPKLWSIKGINGEYTAEIIQGQTIHTVKLATGARFQQWEVMAFDSDSVTLTEHGSHPKSSKASTSRKTEAKAPLKLYVAARGHSISPYRIPAENDINTPQRQAAAELPAAAAPAPAKY